MASEEVAAEAEGPRSLLLRWRLHLAAAVRARRRPRDGGLRSPARPGQAKAGESAPRIGTERPRRSTTRRPRRRRPGFSREGDRAATAIPGGDGLREPPLSTEVVCVFSRPGGVAEVCRQGGGVAQQGCPCHGQDPPGGGWHRQERREEIGHRSCRSRRFSRKERPSREKLAGSRGPCRCASMAACSWLPWLTPS